MCHKWREETSELQMLSMLNRRSLLTEEEKQYFNNMVKGWEGEKSFDTYIETLSEGNVILNDLLLEVNNTIFQIDSIVISNDTLFLYEIKNFEGDFYYEKERFFTKKAKEISNPLLQLKRTETLLRQLLQKHGYTIPISGFVVFINPEFYLYQVPLGLPIIFSNQLKRHVLHLKKSASPLNKRSFNLAEKLKSLHLEENPYKKIPSYQYEETRKGIICEGCGGFEVGVVGMEVECYACGFKEEFSQAVLRSVKEFQLLFPTEKITTSKIYNWCQVGGGRKRIRRILDKNFTLVFKRRWSYYIDSEKKV